MASPGFWDASAEPLTLSLETGTSVRDPNKLRARQASWELTVGVSRPRSGEREATCSKYALSAGT